ncbi:MAG: RCC1 domain-containing protein [Mycoplasma sp.]
MKKTNKKLGKYLIAPIVSLFTLVTIGASVGLSSSGSSSALGNTIAKAKMQTAEGFNVLKEGGVTSIKGATYFSAAISDKKLFAWGKNDKGQLGIGDDLTDKTTPVYVDVDGDKDPENDDILEIGVGLDSMIARTSSGLYSWGSNTYGQLGLGDDSENQYNTPQKIDIVGNVTAISALNGFVIATVDSNAYMWGYNGDGQLGLGDKINRKTPTKLSSVGQPKMISVGGGFTMVLNTSNELYVFGSNAWGQLGLGDDYLEKEYTTPIKMNTSNLGTISQIYASTYSSYLINSSGEAFSCGYNFSGILGLGDQTDRNTPTKMPINSKVKQITGRMVAMGLVTDNGETYTWGSNTTIQLGQGPNAINYLEPTKMPAIDESIDKIVQFDYHGFAISTSGKVYGWGNNIHGNIGVGDTTLREFAVIVDNSNAHKDLNILDLSTVAGADILKEKIVADVTDEEIIDLIKANGEDLFTNYKEDNVITIKSIDKKEASYLDSETGEFFGKIEITFNNDKQCEGWAGSQNINDVKFTPGNVDKKLTITKFKQSDLERISKLNANAKASITVDDLADEILQNEAQAIEIINEFVDWNQFPKNTKIIKLVTIEKQESLGKLILDITVDKYNAKGTSGQIGVINEETTFEKAIITNLAIPKESNVTAKSLSSDKTLKGLQWDNFETYFGATITDQAKLGQLINFNSFPKGTTYTAQISTQPTADSNKVGITVQASSYYNEKNEKVTTPKTFDETIITIPMVNATSKPVERERMPKDLKPENFANFILETKPTGVKEGESTQTVNFTNLDKILKLSELFPTTESQYELLKIEEDTEFRITDNAISVDGATVTFFLEANQIWNQFGFYEKMTGDWASFKVELEFPGAHSTWVIIGSSVGAAVLLFLIILSLCNKAKLKTVITNRF